MMTGDLNFKQQQEENARIQRECTMEQRKYECRERALNTAARLNRPANGQKTESELLLGDADKIYAWLIQDL